MKSVLENIGIQIARLIDFCYPLFRKYMSRDFFRYGVCGVGNLGFDLFLFFIIYNFIIQKQFVNLGFVVISPHIASFLITFPITLITGFLLQKYVTFTNSNIRGRKQLIRYTSVVGINFLINYFGLKLLVDVLKFYPTPSRMIIMVVTVMVSYLLQKNFTFANKK